MIQQTLRLRYRSWGGRRTRAGQKPGSSSRIRHRSRSLLSRHQPCHVTVRIRRGIPSLRIYTAVRQLEHTFRRRCCRRDFRITHYSIQGNHIHMIAEATNPDSLGRGMKSIGPGIALAVHRAFHRRGPVLADRYHMRVLKTPREVRAALAYVLLNDQRHAGPSSGAAWLDPASSARWFNGWGGLHATTRDPPAVAPARTWLLTQGWRRHGLLAQRYSRPLAPRTTIET